MCVRRARWLLLREIVELGYCESAFGALSSNTSSLMTAARLKSAEIVERVQLAARGCRRHGLVLCHSEHGYPSERSF